MKNVISDISVQSQRFGTLPRSSVRNFPMPSLNTTVAIAAGTAFRVNMATATEWSEFFEMAKRVAGCDARPKVLSINIAVKQVVTVPNIPLLTDVYEASFYERRAADDLQLSFGNAAASYLRTKPYKAALVQLYLDTYIAPDICAISRLKHPDCVVSTSRIRRSDFDHAGLGGAPELSEDHNFYGRTSRPYPSLDGGPMRGIAQNSGGTLTEPANDTPAGDVYVIATTWDGVMGVEAQGVDAAALMDATKPWYITLTPQNRTTLYRNGVGGGQDASFGDFTLEVSITWCANEANTEGATWMIRDDLALFNAAGQNIYNPPDVQDAEIMGWLPIIHDPSTDGNKEYIMRLSSAPATPLDVTLRVIYPPFNPSLNFWTRGSVLQVGDGTQTQTPEITNTLAVGYQQLEQWNDTQKSFVSSNPLRSRSGFPELPIYGAAGERAFTTTQWAGASVRYGTTYAGGAAYTTNDATRLSEDYSRIAGMGGIFYPISWGNSEIPGFPNVAFRTSKDERTVIAQPVQGWTPPTNPSGTPFRVSAIYRKAPYSSYAVSSNGQCDDKHSTPVSLKAAMGQASENAPMGNAITTTFVMPGVTTG